jgi:hypothetical protein
MGFIDSILGIECEGGNTGSVMAEAARHNMNGLQTGRAHSEGRHLPGLFSVGSQPNPANDRQMLINDHANEAGYEVGILGW